MNVNTKVGHGILIGLTALASSCTEQQRQDFRAWNQRQSEYNDSISKVYAAQRDSMNRAVEARNVEALRLKTVSIIPGLSAEQYARSVGKELSDYNLVGVHGRAIKDGDIYRDPLCKETLVLPSGTEVVVNFEQDMAGGGFLEDIVTDCTGIAMVPKMHKE